jgi:hypothetical protein
VCDLISVPFLYTNTIVTPSQASVSMVLYPLPLYAHSPFVSAAAYLVATFAFLPDENLKIFLNGLGNGFVISYRPLILWLIWPL